VIGDLDDRERCELQIALGGALARAGNAAGARTEFLEAATLAERLGLAEELARAAVGYGGQFVWLRAGSDKTLVSCVWADSGSLGQVYCYFRSQSDCAALFPQVRNAILKRG